jgi:hypothetical protein
VGKTFASIAVLGLLALSVSTRAADPAMSLAELRSKGFVGPCKQLVVDEKGPQELLRNVVVGPNSVWTLVNYRCGSMEGTVPKGLFFQDFNQPAFHPVASYTRDLEVSGNSAGDWLVFVNEPSDGESNAFILPVAAFNGPGRLALPDMPGALVNFADANPAGFVDLTALYRSVIPPKYDGRSMVQASWQDDGTVGLFIYARNQAEDDTWSGCATYTVKSAKMDKIAHLPYQGFDWIGNIKVTEANSHIDLQ